MKHYSQPQRSTLALLREAGRRPVSIADLLAAGITQPATVIYELSASASASQESSG